MSVACLCVSSRVALPFGAGCGERDRYESVVSSVAVPGGPPVSVIESVLVESGEHRCVTPPKPPLASQGSDVLAFRLSPTLSLRVHCPAKGGDTRAPAGECRKLPQPPVDVPVARRRPNALHLRLVVGMGTQEGGLQAERKGFKLQPQRLKVLRPCQLRRVLFSGVEKKVTDCALAFPDRGVWETGSRVGVLEHGPSTGERGRGSFCSGTSVAALRERITSSLRL